VIHGEITDGGDYTTACKVYPVFHSCKHDVPVNGGHRILQTGSCFEISFESCTPTTPSKTAAVFTQIAQEIMTCGKNWPPVVNSAVSARKLTLTFFNMVPTPFNHFVYSAAQASVHVIRKKIDWV
jgi:hypothetical protein